MFWSSRRSVPVLSFLCRFLLPPVQHRRLLWLCLPLLLVGPEATSAGESLERSDRAEATLDEEDDTALFVVGNTLFAVYHELGHALIDLLELPVIGREEDAADGFAAVMMIPGEPDLLRDELIIAVADGWRLQSEQAAANVGQDQLWAEHALDEQRHFAVVCWMVGSDQEGFSDLASESGMPIERVETCADDFDRMQASWQRLLASHRVTAASADDDRDGRIAIVFEEPRRDDLDAFAWARMGGLIERSILEFERNIQLPEDIVVRFKSCDEANAFWHGERREVLMCYGLIGDFLSILEG